ncbi:hypothetical protein BH10BAC2_BH10BAC2_04960 [soil metagenome]
MQTGIRTMKSLVGELLNNVQKDKVLATQQAMLRSANAGIYLIFIMMK